MVWYFHIASFEPAFAAITLSYGLRFRHMCALVKLRSGLAKLVIYLLFASLSTVATTNGGRQSNSPDQALFQKGQQDLVAYRDSEALDIFRHLLAAGMKTAPVYSNLGIAYMRAGDFDQAVRSLDKAKQLAPALPGIDLNLGLARYRQREYALAANSFASHLERDPDSTQARFLKAVCSYMMNDYEDAAAEFIRLHDSQSSVDYFFMLGISLAELKRVSESEQAFARMIAAGGDGPEVHLLVAQADLALHDNQKAETEIAKVMAVAPDIPFAHYYRGIIYEARGDYTHALDDFEQEARLSPQELWAFEHAGAIRLEEGDATGAVRILESGRHHNPHSATLLGSLAKAYLRLNDPQRAIENLTAALKEEPQDGGLHYQLARAYQKAGMNRAASAELRLADRLYKDADRRQVRSLYEEQRLKQSVAKPAPTVP
jgi:tetratricopeptide (TPR) repeat protein